MQFKVPQFLDIEDKIFGPFTFSEFVYLTGGAGISYFIYELLGLFLGAIPIILVMGFSIALVYYKPNKKPFVNMVEAAILYVAQDKLYIWQRKRIKKTIKKAGGDLNDSPKETHHDPRLNGGKLRDLAWSLDILDSQKEDKSDKSNLSSS